LADRSAGGLKGTKCNISKSAMAGEVHQIAVNESQRAPGQCAHRADRMDLCLQRVGRVTASRRSEKGKRLGRRQVSEKAD